MAGVCRKVTSPPIWKESLTHEDGFDITSEHVFASINRLDQVDPHDQPEIHGVDVQCSAYIDKGLGDIRAADVCGLWYKVWSFNMQNVLSSNTCLRFCSLWTTTNVRVLVFAYTHIHSSCLVMTKPLSEITHKGGADQDRVRLWREHPLAKIVSCYLFSVYMYSNLLDTVGYRMSLHMMCKWGIYVVYSIMLIICMFVSLMTLDHPEHCHVCLSKLQATAPYSQIISEHMTFYWTYSAHNALTFWIAEFGWYYFNR